MHSFRVELGCNKEVGGFLIQHQFVLFYTVLCCTEFFFVKLKYLTPENHVNELCTFCPESSLYHWGMDAIGWTNLPLICTNFPLPSTQFVIHLCLVWEISNGWVFSLIVAGLADGSALIKLPNSSAVIAQEAYKGRPILSATNSLCNTRALFFCEHIWRKKSHSLSPDQDT